MEKRRRQHSAQIAELQMALDKAQRAAEEAPRLYVMVSQYVSTLLTMDDFGYMVPAEV